jgi:hypothetical protein
MTFEDTKEPQDNARASQNSQPDRETSDSDLNWVMAINVESLRWPEHDDGEEIRPGDECDNERKGKDPGFLLQAWWEDGIVGPVYLPETKSNQEGETEYQWDKNVSCVPFVLGLMLARQEGTRAIAEGIWNELIPDIHPIAVQPGRVSSH